MADIIELFRRIARTEDQSPRIQWIFAGLGNPGPRYEGTRHNVGYRAVEQYARESGVRIDRARFRGLCAEVSVADRRILLLEPQTFMNLSGESVAEALNWYKLPPERLVVFHDDISLEPGRIRVRGKGSAGGHNGIENIIHLLGTDGFYRIKIGVGAPPNREYDLADWVLSKIGGADLDDALKRAADAGRCLITEGLEETMHRYNGKPPKKDAES